MEDIRNPGHYTIYNVHATYIYIYVYRGRERKRVVFSQVLDKSRNWEHHSIIANFNTAQIAHSLTLYPKSQEVQEAAELSYNPIVDLKSYVEVAAVFLELC